MLGIVLTNVLPAQLGWKGVVLALAPLVTHAEGANGRWLWSGIAYIVVVSVYLLNEG